MSEPSDNITLHIYDIIIHEKDVTVQVTEKKDYEKLTFPLQLHTSPCRFTNSLKSRLNFKRNFLKQTDTGEMLEIVGHSYDEERQFYIVNLAQV